MELNCFCVFRRFKFWLFLFQSLTRSIWVKWVVVNSVHCLQFYKAKSFHLVTRKAKVRCECFKKSARFFIQNRYTKSHKICKILKIFENEIQSTELTLSQTTTQAWLFTLFHCYFLPSWIIFTPQISEDRCAPSPQNILNTTQTLFFGRCS